MAKQRRTRPRTSSGKSAQSRTRRSALPAPAQPERPTGSLLEKRTSYIEAVGLYERGLEALQHRDFSAAADALRAVLDRYPDERELHERVRLYLKVCERETGPPPPAPRTPDERVGAATLAINAGAHDEALEHLRVASEENPDHDHVQYMLAVVHSLRGDRELALSHLRRSIELNPENRVLARQEPDFEAIRHDEAFRLAVETPPRPPTRRRARGRKG